MRPNTGGKHALNVPPPRATARRLAGQGSTAHPTFRP